MNDLLRRPRQNALILGLLQGIPQGMYLPDQKAFVGAGFDSANWALFVLFGLIGPPVFMTLSHFSNRRRQHAWWVKISEFVDLPQMIFWGGLSLGIVGYFTLKSSGAQEGYAICGFFLAAAIGFLFAGALEKWLLRRAANAT